MSIKNKTKDRDNTGRIKRSVTKNAGCSWLRGIPKDFRRSFHHTTKSFRTKTY